MAAQVGTSPVVAVSTRAVYTKDTDPRALIRALGDPEREVSVAASQALWEQAEQHSISPELLIEALGSENARVRRAVAIGLASMRGHGTAAVPYLVRALKDEHSLVRQAAALALASIGEGAMSAVSPLCDAVADQDPDVRDAALLAVRALQPAPTVAVPVMCECLRHKDERVRFFAARWLVELIRKGRAPRELRKQTQPVLIEALKSNDADARWCAAYELGCMGGDATEAAPTLAEVVSHDEDLKARGTAAWALAQIGSDDAKVVQALIDRLNDKREAPAVRTRAAWSLSSIRSSQALGALRQAIKDNDDTVRCYATSALGHTADRASETDMHALTDALNDPKGKVRLAAAWALGVIGPAAVAAVPHLLKALKARDREFRLYVASALARITPQAKAGLATLKRALKDEHAYRRCLGASALAHINPRSKAVIATLIDLVKTDDRVTRQNATWSLRNIGPHATPALAALIEALKDDYHHVRSNAVEALARIGSKAAPAVPAVRAMVEDANEYAYIRFNAAYALESIGVAADHRGLLGEVRRGAKRLRRGKSPDPAPSFLEAEHPTSAHEWLDEAFETSQGSIRDLDTGPVSDMLKSRLADAAGSMLDEAPDNGNPVQLHWRIAKRVEAELNAKYADREFQSLEQTRAAVQDISKHFQKYALRVLCPKKGCHRAATLRLQSTGTNSPTGTVRYEHYTDGRQSYHLGRTKLEELSIVPISALNDQGKVVIHKLRTSLSSS